MDSAEYEHATAQQLLNELLELENQKRENSEDCSLYDEIGPETEHKHALIQKEILKRMGQGVKPSDA